MSQFSRAALFLSIGLLPAAMSETCYDRLAKVVALCATCELDHGIDSVRHFDKLAESILPRGFSVTSGTRGSFMRSVLESHPNKDDEITQFKSGATWGFDVLLKEGRQKFLAEKFKVALAAGNLNTPEAMQGAIEKMHSALRQVGLGAEGLKEAEFAAFENLHARLAASGKLYVKKQRDYNAMSALDSLKRDLGKDFPAFLAHYQTLTEAQKQALASVLPLTVRDETLWKTSKGVEAFTEKLLKLAESRALEEKTLDPKISEAINTLAAATNYEAVLRRDLNELVLEGALKIEIYPGSERFDRKPEFYFGPPPRMAFHEGTKLSQTQIMMMIRAARHVKNGALVGRVSTSQDDATFIRQKQQSLAGLLAAVDHSQAKDSDFVNWMDQMLRSVVDRSSINPDLPKSVEAVRNLAAARTKLLKASVVASIRERAKILRDKILEEAGDDSISPSLLNLALRKRLQAEVSQQLQNPFPFISNQIPEDFRLPRVWQYAVEENSRNWVEPLLQELAPQ